MHLKARSLCWSPDDTYLTVLEKDGLFKLWCDKDGSWCVVHSSDGIPVTCVQWHPSIGKDGDMLMAR